MLNLVLLVIHAAENSSQNTIKFGKLDVEISKLASILYYLQSLEKGNEKIEKQQIKAISPIIKQIIDSANFTSTQKKILLSLIDEEKIEKKDLEELTDLIKNIIHLAFNSLDGSKLTENPYASKVYNSIVDIVKKEIINLINNSKETQEYLESLFICIVNGKMPSLSCPDSAIKVINVIYVYCCFNAIFKDESESKKLIELVIAGLNSKDKVISSISNALTSFRDKIVSLLPSQLVEELNNKENINKENIKENSDFVKAVIDFFSNLSEKKIIFSNDKKNFKIFEGLKGLTSEEKLLLKDIKKDPSVINEKTKIFPYMESFDQTFWSLSAGIMEAIVDNLSKEQKALVESQLGDKFNIVRNFIVINRLKSLLISLHSDQIPNASSYLNEFLKEDLQNFILQQEKELIKQNKFVEIQLNQCVLILIKYMTNEITKDQMQESIDLQMKRQPDITMLKIKHKMILHIFNILSEEQTMALMSFFPRSVNFQRLKQCAILCQVSVSEITDIIKDLYKNEINIDLNLIVDFLLEIRNQVDISKIIKFLGGYITIRDLGNIKYGVYKTLEILLDSLHPEIKNKIKSIEGLSLEEVEYKIRKYIDPSININEKLVFQHWRYLIEKVDDLCLMTITEFDDRQTGTPKKVLKVSDKVYKMGAEPNVPSRKSVIEKFRLEYLVRYMESSSIEEKEKWGRLVIFTDRLLGNINMIHFYKILGGTMHIGKAAADFIKHLEQNFSKEYDFDVNLLSRVNGHMLYTSHLNLDPEFFLRDLNNIKKGNLKTVENPILREILWHILASEDYETEKEEMLVIMKLLGYEVDPFSNSKAIIESICKKITSIVMPMPYDDSNDTDILPDKNDVFAITQFLIGKSKKIPSLSSNTRKWLWFTSNPFARYLMNGHREIFRKEISSYSDDISKIENGKIILKENKKAKMWHDQWSKKDFDYYRYNLIDILSNFNTSLNIDSRINMEKSKIIEYMSKYDLELFNMYRAQKLLKNTENVGKEAEEKIKKDPLISFLIASISEKGESLFNQVSGRINSYIERFSNYKKTLNEYDKLIDKLQSASQDTIVEIIAYLNTFTWSQEPDSLNKYLSQSLSQEAIDIRKALVKFLEQAKSDEDNMLEILISLMKGENVHISKYVSYSNHYDSFNDWVKKLIQIIILCRSDKLVIAGKLVKQFRKSIQEISISSLVKQILRIVGKGNDEEVKVSENAKLMNLFETLIIAEENNPSAQHAKLEMIRSSFYGTQKSYESVISAIVSTRELLAKWVKELILLINKTVNNKNLEKALNTIVRKKNIVEKFFSSSLAIKGGVLAAVIVVAVIASFFILQ